VAEACFAEFVTIWHIFCVYTGGLNIDRQKPHVGRVIECLKNLRNWPDSSPNQIELHASCHHNVIHGRTICHQIKMYKQLINSKLIVSFKLLQQNLLNFLANVDRQQQIIVLFSSLDLNFFSFGFIDVVGRFVIVVIVAAETRETYDQI
jgi:hypothetical protein